MESAPKSIRILLVEDDEDDYLIIRECLTELRDHVNYELDWVQTYQEGLTQIQLANHNIYLIDHYLGAGSGLDLLSEAIKAGCQAPIIMVTGQSDRAIDQAALIAGATDYLVKDKLDGQLLERSIRYALEQNRLLKQIRELAVRDALTGLYNRRELYRVLDFEIAKSQRYGNSFSLAMMDIDHFKHINDRFGHRIGDEILQEVAEVLLVNTRSHDLLARFGGDEFIVVLRDTSTSQAWQGVDRIQKVLEDLSIEKINLHGDPEKIKVAISVGVAEYPSDANSSNMLIEAADQALYRARHLGYNQSIKFHMTHDIEQSS